MMSRTVLVRYLDNLEINTGKRDETAIRKVLHKQAIQEALEHDLTAMQKTVVMMYFFESKNIPAIAEELSLNKSTVSRHLTGAKKRLIEFTDIYLRILGIDEKFS
ncbi:MAG: sigma factor-like helix-turn-helix DNA-binding protein [Oscillospiraceae bacterium]